MLADNEELRRELQEGKWREKLAQKEEQERLIGFGRNLEELRVHKMNSSVEERTSEPEVLIPPPSSELAKVALDLLDEGEKNEHEKVLHESKEENSRLRRQIATFEKKEADFKLRLKLEQDSLDN